MEVNVYLIQNDGEAGCWKAETAAQAIAAAAEAFEKEAIRENYELGDETARAYWERTCFQSCALVGELENP